MNTTHDRTAEVRHDVTWQDYVTLYESLEETGARITYHDGTLIVMSPEYVHEGGAEILGMIVREVALALDLEFACAGSTTFRRKGQGPRKGSGKEPDTCFYFGNNATRIWGKTTIDLAIDPPPDLAIEVENKADSDYGLAVYANLRVPEVWRFDARERTLWFGRLAGGTYHEIKASIGLPVLTPDVVLGAIEASEQVASERAWMRWLRVWAAELVEGRVE